MLISFGLFLLNAFDPRIESHRQINLDGVSNFFHKVQIINKNVVLFKSIEICDTTVCSDFSSLIVQNIKEKVLLQNTKTEQETTQIFLKNMSICDKTIKQLKKATRGQSENELWHQIRLGRLTASNHHNIYTKMNSVLK